MSMISPTNHGYHKAGESMRPSGGDGLRHANSEALRAERDRVRDDKRDHPEIVARFLWRFRSHA